MKLVQGFISFCLSSHEKTFYIMNCEWTILSGCFPRNLHWPPDNKPNVLQEISAKSVVLFLRNCFWKHKNTGKNRINSIFASIEGSNWLFDCEIWPLYYTVTISVSPEVMTRFSSEWMPEQEHLTPLQNSINLHYLLSDTWTSITSNFKLQRVRIFTNKRCAKCIFIKVAQTWKWTAVVL